MLKRGQIPKKDRKNKNHISTYKRSTLNPGRNTRNMMNTGDTGLTWGLQNNQTDKEQGPINKWNTGEQEQGMEKEKGKK